MTAFFASLIGLVLVLGAVMAYGRRRPAGTPLTWGEAMVGAVVVFAIMFVAYGIVPHQFLNWADSGLNWRSDAIGIPAGPLSEVLNKDINRFVWITDFYDKQTNTLFPTGISFFGRGQVLVSKEAVRDMLAAGLYIVFLGGHIAMWVMWQKRGKKSQAAKAIEPASAYGRPLLKKA